MRQVVVEVVLDPLPDEQADEMGRMIAEHLHSLRAVFPHIKRVSRPVVDGPYYRPHTTNMMHYERS